MTPNQKLILAMTSLILAVFLTVFSFANHSQEKGLLDDVVYKAVSKYTTIDGGDTVVLLVSEKGDRGIVWFKKGKLVHAFERRVDGRFLLDAKEVSEEDFTQTLLPLQKMIYEDNLKRQSQFEKSQLRRTLLFVPPCPTCNVSSVSSV